MKVITEGDFPIFFDESDVPWGGDDLVPVFRTNAINDEAECQHSWPSLSIMYYLRNRKNVLRDSRKSWDPYFTEMKATYPWEDKEKPKGIYQLQGGIQKYLESYGNEEHGLSNRGDNSDAKTGTSESDDVGKNTANDNKACLYRGKNFVFDPRRTDPIIGNGITNNYDTLDSSQEKCVSVVGQCNICSCPHDYYDNGHSPSEEKESRCCHCRMLVLVCNGCR